MLDEMKRMTVFGEMERTAEDAVMTYFKMLSWYSHGEVEKNTKITWLDNCHQDSNQRLPKYMSNTLLSAQFYRLHVDFDFLRDIILKIGVKLCLTTMCLLNLKENHDPMTHKISLISVKVK